MPCKLFNELQGPEAREVAALLGVTENSPSGEPYVVLQIHDDRICVIAHATTSFNTLTMPLSSRRDIEGVSLCITDRNTGVKRITGHTDNFSGYTLDAQGRRHEIFVTEPEYEIDKLDQLALAVLSKIHKLPSSAFL